jgi:hypothetical protein
LRTICFREGGFTVLVDELSPTAKALMALELIQDCPGITGAAAR